MLVWSAIEMIPWACAGKYIHKEVIRKKVVKLLNGRRFCTRRSYKCHYPALTNP